MRQRFPALRLHGLSAFGILCILILLGCVIVACAASGTAQAVAILVGVLLLFVFAIDFVGGLNQSFPNKPHDEFSPPPADFRQ